MTHASPSSYLAITTERHGRRSVLRVRGELDAANQDLLRCVIRSVVDHHSPLVLLLDLSALGFADCAGLSAVLWAHKRLAGQGHELVLAGIQPLVRRLLNITGLDTYLHVSTLETPLAPAGRHAVAMAAEDYEVRWVGQHAVIRMPAEIDAASADEIRQALLAAVSPGTAILIIDMGGTTFCDSAGLKSIIAAHARAAETGTQLRLVATAVLRIITIVGIDQLIPIYPTLEAALTEA